MAYDLKEINTMASDPHGFAQACERGYREKVIFAAESIARRRSRSPVVFLSGPSGSGKTTTAKKICDELGSLGIRAYTISLDNYYLTLDYNTAPKTDGGELDRESPYCLDLELINRHFHMLENNEEIQIPRYNFKMQSRQAGMETPLKLKADEIAVFEGIHALNDMITNEHPNAFKLYISARSDVLKDEETYNYEHGCQPNGSEKVYDCGETCQPNGSTKVCFKGTWTRLMRRAVRDEFFRGAGAQQTLMMWENVRRGEKAYISPFKTKADIIFDSSLKYEIPVMKRFAELVFNKIPDGAGRFAELRQILPALSEFADINPEAVPQDSILREFIGGGKYKY